MPQVSTVDAGPGGIPDRQPLLTDEKPPGLETVRLREEAVSRWENEGGAGVLQRLQCHPVDSLRPGEVPPLTNAELSQLHIRVIALEGLVTALLADASDSQLDLARDMAAYITPRPGFTDHPLTIRAATQMINLVERAGRFRTRPADDSAATN